MCPEKNKGAGRESGESVIEGVGFFRPGEKKAQGGPFQSLQLPDRRVESGGGQKEMASNCATWGSN